VDFDIGNDLAVVIAAIVDTVATKQFVDEPHKLVLRLVPGSEGGSRPTTDLRQRAAATPAHARQQLLPPVAAAPVDG
jgi:hypothetical protein